MYIESFTLQNFRKFKKENNCVLLAYEKSRDQYEEKEVNISATSTLVIGKNNVGKTSVVTALKKLTGKENFEATDFNFTHLKEFLSEFENNPEQAEMPKIEFTVNLKLDDMEDIISNIAPILYLNDTSSAVLQISVVIKEVEVFVDRLNQLIDEEEPRRFRLLLKAIDEVGLELIYFDNDGQELKNDFKLKDLIEIKAIEANKISHQSSLTQAFNKIIKHRYEKNKDVTSNSIDDQIEDINQNLTTSFKERHQDDVNESLRQIEHQDKLKINLISNLTHEQILKNNVLVYEYVENDLSIPESQYGLGYTNLVMIIAEIIEYIERAPVDSFTSKINIISIEEPETYMHPQMQELFIKNINAAIEQLLESQDKYVNSQIIITTHSSHILNSKIHSGNSFNHINYLTEKDREIEIVNLKDNTIVEDDSENGKAKNLEFLKKHIKFKVSELFYSDAAIFVEGVTEEILIKNYIDHHTELQKYYISIFNIDGAHGLVYHNLIKQLKIPSLIITDLDIKITDKNNEEKTEDEIYYQVKTLEDKITTNKTLKHYFGEKLYDINDNKRIEDNLYITFQGKQSGYYPTSFEEALILTHYDNNILKTALEGTKPKIYSSYHQGHDENLKNYSRLLQKKLDDVKNEFANRLLAELVSGEHETNTLSMPEYIENGLNWIKCQLKGEPLDVRN